MSKVSILLPVYNGEEYLAQSIESVLAQTHTDWELLVSDNCSLDATGEIAKQYAERDKRVVYWRNEKNIGLFPNYNKCIENAKGDYLELFGADDIFEPTCLEKLANVLDNNPAVALAICARNIIDESGKWISTDRPFDSSRVVTSDETIRTNLSTFTNWIVSPVMYRSDHKGGGFDARLRVWADIDYWSKVVQGGDLFYLNEVLFSYRVHSQSETTRVYRDLEFVIDVMRMADRYASYLVSGNASEVELKRAIAERLVLLARHAVDHRNATFESLQLPITQEGETAILADFDNGQDPTKLRSLANDLHDYKRAVCLTLLHAIELGKEREEAQHERNLATLQSESLNGRIAELSQEIEALRDQQKKVFAKRDLAVSEKDQWFERTKELKEEIRRLEATQTALSEQRDVALKENEILRRQIDQLSDSSPAAPDHLEQPWDSQSAGLTASLRKLKEKLFR
jgi:glycosyltransferase involved in cell wall biosynthesis